MVTGLAPSTHDAGGEGRNVDWLGKFPLSDNIRILATLGLALLLWIWSIAASRLIQRHVPDYSRGYALRKLISYAAFFLFAFFAAVIWQRHVQGLSTFLGLIGAGIAFSLQEVIASIAGWVMVTWKRTYRVGDRVEIGGIQGDVIDLGLVRTTLMETGSWVNADQQTGRVVTISNATALRQPVFNYTAYFPYLWDGLTIPVTFRSDWERAMTIIREEVARFQSPIQEEAAETLELMRRSFYLPKSEAKPGVYVRFTDNWIEISVRYLAPSRERRTASSELSQAILRRLLAEPSITIASESMRISVLKASTQKPG